MSKKMIAAAVAFLASNAAAVAADFPVKSPVVASPALEYNWSGFYIGAHVGGIWGETNSFPSGSGAPITIEPSGIFAGVHAGVDWQLANRIVLGLRVAAPIGASADDTVTDPVFATVKHKGELRWAVAFTGHIGLAMNRFLPYVGAGFVLGEGKASFTSPGGNDSDSQTHTGYTVLAGIRYAVSDQWWVAVQYNFTDLGKETYTFPTFAQTRNISFESHSITGLISYRWGGGGAVIARY